MSLTKDLRSFIVMKKGNHVIFTFFSFRYRYCFKMKFMRLFSWTMLSPLRFRPVWANDRQSDKGIPATTALRQEGHTHTRILAVCPLHQVGLQSTSFRIVPGRTSEYRYSSSQLLSQARTSEYDSFSSHIFALGRTSCYRYSNSSVLTPESTQDYSYFISHVLAPGGT